MTHRAFHLRNVLCAVCVILAASAATRVTTAKPPRPAATPGVVTEQPDDGRFVKIDGGYMVPYTETIPGTDVAFEMIPIAGGEFVMGSPDGEADRADDEGPQVRVKVEPFWAAKCEVTWAQYKSFMAMYDVFKKLQNLSAVGAGNGANPELLQIVKQHAWNGKVEEEWDVDAVTAPTPLYEPTFTFSIGEDPEQPAVTITPFAAKQFTKWLSGITGSGYRLPTEAEWEYAARAGTTTAYSFGDDTSQLEDYAWTEDNSDFATHPVGTKKPNPWGLHDVHGNAGELTLDEFAADTYAKLAPGPVEAAAAVRWPTKMFPRVIRGGSWYEAAPAARSAARQKTEDTEWKFSDPNIPKSPWWFTEEPAMAVGLRVIRPLKPLTEEDKKRVWEVDHDDLRQDVRDRLREGRGALGRTGKTLPQAAQAAEELEKASNR
jgi:formylglycine-generating enzyme required for sulfatase activity